MKLTPHEQKILSLISENPEIVTNPKERSKIAKANKLTEKTLRNRIAELKKRGLISNNSNKNDFNQKISIDLDIESLIQMLSEKKTFILKWTFFITLSFMLYSILATPYYESKITVYPAGTLVESGNMMNNLQGIAESFGLGGVNNSQTFNIPDIVNSRRLKKSIILSKWETNKFKDKVNLVVFWELDKPNFLNPRTLIKKILPFSSAHKDTLGAQIFDALEKMDDAILINENRTGLIEVTVLMEEPELASKIANYIAQFIKDFIAAEEKKEATRNKNFIYEQLLKSKADLEKSEDELTSFREKNPLTRIPSLEEYRGRLERNIQSNLQVYITLRQQYEIAKIDEAKDHLLVTILDEAEPAIYKSKPKRTLITILGLITGLFFSFFTAFFISVYNLNKKN